MHNLTVDLALEAQRLTGFLTGLDPIQQDETYKHLQDKINFLITMSHNADQIIEPHSQEQTILTPEASDQPETKPVTKKKSQTAGKTAKPDPKPDPAPAEQPAPPPTPDPDPAAPTFAEIKAAAQQLSAISDEGSQRFLDILQEFGAARISALLPEHFPAALKKIQAAMADLGA